VYTVDYLENNNYHSDVIRSKLVRITPTVLQEIHDELVLALNDLIPMVDEGMPQAFGKHLASS